MAIGSRKNRDDYIFVDGRAVRASEIAPPGAGEASGAPGAEDPLANRGDRRHGGRRGHRRGQRADGSPEAEGSMRQAARDLAQDDAFALREGVESGEGYLLGGESLRADDRRKLRRLYVVFGLLLLIACCVSFSADTARLAFRAPVDTLQGIATWLQVQFAALFDQQNYANIRLAALENVPDFDNVAFQFGSTMKFALCGVMLAVSGMLYQNAFRNPIAAPSMLGVTNGVNFAVLVLVMVFGYNAYQQLGLYYLFSYIGGALVLLLVLIGGKWTSGRRGFNVVNMILVGTIVSQLLGVIISYVENNFFTEMDWEAYNDLVQAVGITCVWTYVSVIAGSLATLIPIFLFRFRLNLVSFSDEEAKFLGVNPTRLRLLALGCGSFMILTAQVNAGQVAMMSLVVPFVVRAVFGSEFRKQLGGNILVGALLLVICGLLSQYIVINQMQAGLGAVTTFIALPLFVWMLAIRQRSWD